MEARTMTPSLPAAAERRWRRPPLRRPLGPDRGARCLPVYYGIRDLTHGYQAGVVHGQAVIHHDLTKLGDNLVQGLSNGSIWALIAIGYTLVYGIIELINFAHGDVFMIGSFTAVGLWGAIGLGLATGALGLVVGPGLDADRRDGRSAAA